MSRRLQNLQITAAPVRGHVQLTYVKPTTNGNYFSITSPPFLQSEPKSIRYALNHFLIQLETSISLDTIEAAAKSQTPAQQLTGSGTSES